MTDKNEAPLDFGQSSGANEILLLKDNNFSATLQADIQDNLEVLKSNKEIPQQFSPEPFNIREQIIPENTVLLLKTLQTAKINIHAELAPAPVALSIINENEECKICSLGDFSLVTGKAKSRKTFTITMALAAACTNMPILNKFIGHLPENQKRVVFFDTEQSTYHVQKVCKRIVKLIGHVPDNFEGYSLRMFNPAERLAMIEAFIYENDGLGFIVIDGVRDLVSSINDEVQSTFITSKLLKWSGERNIHIICILHQNKSDNNARGHIGTELVNKAETVLSVSKEGDFSIVQVTESRDISPTPFSFIIDSDGLPMIADAPIKKTKESKGKTQSSPLDISSEIHKKNLCLAFERINSPNYTELWNNIKVSFASSGIPIGDNKAKEYLTYYEINNFIVKIGKTYNLIK